VDRAYVCQYCSTRFESYFELKTHMKQHSHQKVGVTTGMCSYVNSYIYLNLNIVCIIVCHTVTLFTIMPENIYIFISGDSLWFHQSSNLH
jgi:fumarate reductase subunit C